jgi:hypothetical protein
MVQVASSEPSNDAMWPSCTAFLGRFIRGFASARSGSGKLGGIYALAGTGYDEASSLLPELDMAELGSFVTRTGSARQVSGEKSHEMSSREGPGGSGRPRDPQMSGKSV